ncbi:DUF4184 family protein [Micromonospora sp. NBC_01699]|uniref:DUF4184 family protein n=1 Tax=Micromonospora sp. NBC_01699 TaxID=2975984 RepID=UPI002E2C78D9|nr:DUF4184 family protein [Micromonospora sp. NBC_01699]
MPFTGSHPAAVLPFLRSGLVPSALVIGSMTPDLPYFLPTSFSGTTTHTLAGALTVDVLLGGVAFGVWQAVLAPFAVAIAPAALRDRLDPRLPRGLAFHLRGWRKLGVLAASLAVGAATHVGWDSFTHLLGWGPSHVAWLADTHAGLPGYRWAQYASTIVGATALAGWFTHWWFTSTPQSRTETRAPLARPVAYAAWAFIGFATLAGGLLGARPHLPQSSPYVTVFLVLTRGGGAGLITALGCALAWLALSPKPEHTHHPLPPTP